MAEHTLSLNMNVATLRALDLMRYFAALSSLLLFAAGTLAMFPETKKIPVSDTYHGVVVQDDYRWLESWDNKEVQAWSDRQNQYARAYLDRLPNVTGIRKRVTEVMEAKTVGYGGLAARHGVLFAIKREPPKQQPFLIVIPSLETPDKTRILVDPNVIDAKSTTTIDWYVPSPDGHTVAVSLSHGGSESGDVHFYDVETAKEIHEVVPRVNSGTAGGDLAWTPDGAGVFYTRHPRPGERSPADLNFYQQIYYHKLGSPTESDRYELGKDFPRIAETEFEMHDKSGTLLARVQNGDGGEFAHYLRSLDGKWTRINDFPDKIVQATFGPNNDLYLISRVNADRGKILRLSLAKPLIELAETIVPENQDTVVTSFYHAPPSMVVTESRLFVVYQLGGPSELRTFDLQGKQLPSPKQLPLSAVGGLTKLAGDDILFSNTSYVSPPSIYRFRVANGQTEKTWLASASPVDFGDVEVIREFATSKDRRNN
jgi:prolyl oligopeptidase